MVQGTEGKPRSVEGYICAPGHMSQDSWLPEASGPHQTVGIFAPVAELEVTAGHPSTLVQGAGWAPSDTTLLSVVLGSAWERALPLGGLRHVHVHIPFLPKLGLDQMLQWGPLEVPGGASAVSPGARPWEYRPLETWAELGGRDGLEPGAQGAGAGHTERGALQKPSRPPR